MFANTNWLSPSIKTGTSHEIPIMLSLYFKTFRYSRHCFIVVNSDPNVLLSMLVCFFENQQTRAELRYKKKPVLDLRVTVSDAWYASTFSLTTKPSPIGSGILGEISSFPSKCQNSLEAHSFRWKLDSPITG